MTGFVAPAVLMAALALCFVLPGLWRRRAETAGLPLPPQRRLAVALTLTIPLLAAGVYRVVGEPAVWTARSDTSIEALELQAQARRGDASAWRALARAYESKGRYGDAVTAYRHLATLQPDDANLFTDFAVTLAMSTGQRLDGEPEKLIEHALALDPNNGQALALSGGVRFERRDYAGAIAQWQRLLAQLPADSPVAASITDSIGKARSLEGGPVRRD